MKNIAIYIRVSTIDQAREGYSLEAQEKTLRKWCGERKYNICDVYADRGISGKDISHRPEMSRLLSDANGKKFDAVIFWALSRFTRSVQDLYKIVGNFMKWDISMISYTEAFDTSTSMGRAMIGIVGVFAQLERELTSERVSAALEERASQGKRTCSEVLGYDLEGKDSLKINEKESEYVRFCFEQYIKRKNLSEVAELCKKKGYRGKRGRYPTPYSIQNILTRPIYCGYNSYNGQLFRGDFENIISAEVYNRVQNIMKNQSKLYGRNRLKDIPKIK